MTTTRRVVLRTLLLLSLGGIPSYSAAAPPAAAEPPAAAWRSEEFPIGFWVGPPPALNTLEAYRLMKDCGFTLATTSIGYTKADNLTMLDHCQTVGLTGWDAGTSWRAMSRCYHTRVCSAPEVVYGQAVRAHRKILRVLTHGEPSDAEN